MQSEAPNPKPETPRKISKLKRSALTLNIGALTLFDAWALEFKAPPQGGGACCFTRRCGNSLSIV
jgi:hypothetical protein